MTDRDDIQQKVLEEMRESDLGEALEIEDLLDGVDRIDPAPPTDRLRLRLAQEIPGSIVTHAPVTAARVGQRPWTGWAAAAALLVVGLTVGRMWGQRDVQQREVEGLRAELQSMSRVVAISLLQHPSASERIRATEYGRRVSTQDVVLDALLEAVANDPNESVRIAALDALADRYDRPGLGRPLVDSLATQNSPMVQLAITDLLLRRGNDRELRRARDTEGIDPEVRARLTRALGT